MKPAYGWEDTWDLDFLAEPPLRSVLLPPPPMPMPEPPRPPPMAAYGRENGAHPTVPRASGSGVRLREEAPEPTAYADEDWDNDRDTLPRITPVPPTLPSRYR